MSSSEPTGVLESQMLARHPDVVVMARFAPEFQEMRIVYANPATERLFGRPAESMVGQPLRALLKDENALLSRDSRADLFKQLRERQQLEFPGAVRVETNGRTRRMRLRMHWAEGDDCIVVIGEDVTEREQHQESLGASERLRSSVDVGSLLSHHVNNELGAALLSVEAALEDLPKSAGPDVRDSLGHATAAMQAASQVVAALAAALRVDAETAGSSDLRLALTHARAAVGPDVRGLEGPSAGDPVFVWGALDQLELILSGVLAFLTFSTRAPIRAELERQGDAVHLRLRGARVSEDVRRSLLDPGEPQAATDARAVRLFMSLQVLRAIGGDLGLPAVGDTGLTVDLTLRAAPGAVESHRHVPLMLVSSDAGLRAVLDIALLPAPVRHSLSVREAVAWLARHRGEGVVLCDVDDLGIAPGEVIAHAQRRGLVLLLRRTPPDPALSVPQLRIPHEKLDLMAAIERARSAWR